MTTLGVCIQYSLLSIRGGYGLGVCVFSTVDCLLGVAMVWGCVYIQYCLLSIRGGYGLGVCAFSKVTADSLLGVCAFSTVNCLLGVAMVYGNLLYA